MFIVKAEVRSDVGPQAYHLFEAPSVRVGKAESIALNAITEKVVHLCDLDGQTCKSLGVGWGLEDYIAVYIMNERGKTVDTVYPGPRPSSMTYPVAMVGQSSQGIQSITSG
jgi:hypothetical protein